MTIDELRARMCSLLVAATDPDVETLHTDNMHRACDLLLLEYIGDDETWLIHGTLADYYGWGG